MYRLAYLLIGLCLYVSVSAAEPLDRIIAIVNDDVITDSELAQRIETVTKQLKQQQRPLPPTDILRSQVLERMIVERAQLQEAQKLGIQIDDDTLNQTLRRIAADNNLSLSEFRNILERDGYEFTRFREDIRRELAMRRLQERQVQSRILVSEQDVEQFLATQDASAATNVEFHIAQILIAVPEAASPAQVDEARERVQDIQNRLANGEDFADVAVAYSDGQQALDGGDMGWRRTAELPTIFANTVPQLKVGSVSDVIRGPSGFHLVKLLDKRGEQRHFVEETNARHILITPDQLIDDARARAELDDLRKQILDGVQFEVLAKEHSDDKPSASEGGSLGWVRAPDVVPEFAQVMAKLAPGEVSEPFKSRYGWHIIQVTDRRTVDDTDAFARNQAQQAIRQRRIEEETELWLRRLRDEAYVEYRFGTAG